MTDQTALIKLFAQKFIARPGIKAVQLEAPLGPLRQGDYIPDSKFKRLPERYGPLGFNKATLANHLRGEVTFGHYMLSEDSKCKLFAFDIDLAKKGSWVELPDMMHLEPGMTEKEFLATTVVHDDIVPVDVWQDRRAVKARSWYKYQLKYIAAQFIKTIQKETGLPCAAAYSGHKGVHVYGFTGLMDAQECLEGALLCMDVMDCWEPARGKVFFKHKNQDPIQGFPSLSVEVFPKQGSLAGKDLGNLMRLPLGKNQHNPKDPTFFIDMRTPLAVMAPHPDPVTLLTNGEPYAD